MTRGYVASAIGAIGGAAGLGVSVGTALSRIPCADEGFECLGVAIVAIFGGAIAAAVGGAVGCYVALRSGHHPGAGLTAWLFVAVGVATGLVGAVVVFPLTAGAAFPIALAAFVCAPVIARALALRLVSRPSSESDDPSDIVGSPPT